MDDFDLIHLVLLCHTGILLIVYWALRDIEKKQDSTLNEILSLSEGLGLTTKTCSDDEQKGFKCQSNLSSETKAESSGAETQ